MKANGIYYKKLTRFKTETRQKKRGDFHPASFPVQEIYRNHKFCPMSSTQTKCLINVQRMKYYEQNDPEMPNNGEFFKTHMF